MKATETWTFVRTGCGVVRNAYPKHVCKIGIGGLDSNEIMLRGSLIAAAPDMLEALQMLAADVKQYEAWQRPCLALDKALAAIAKAEGRAIAAARVAGGREG